MVYLVGAPGLSGWSVESVDSIIVHMKEENGALLRERYKNAIWGTLVSYFMKVCV